MNLGFVARRCDYGGLPKDNDSSRGDLASCIRVRNFFRRMGFQSMTAPGNTRLNGKKSLK
jgi:hypothetical protein